MENQSYPRAEEAKKGNTGSIKPVENTIRLSRVHRKRLNSIRKNIAKQRAEISKYEGSIQGSYPALDIRGLYEKVQYIQTIPSAILKTYPFKNYVTAQIIISGKDNELAKSMQFRKDIGLSLSNLSASSFLNISNLIGEEATVQLGQEALLNKEISYTGYLMAKKMVFQSTTIILIISRGDFIPFTQEEVDNFEILSGILVNIFETGLGYYLTEIMYNNFIMSLETVPLPLSIFNKDNQILFQNLYFDDSSVSKYELEPDIFITIKLSDNNKLVIPYREGDSIIPEISHTKKLVLLGDMIDTLRHELNNPLFGINLASGIISNQIENKNESELLYDIQQCSRRAQDIISELGGLYSGSKQFQKVNLIKTINNIMTLAKSELKLIRRSINTHNIDETFYIDTNVTWLTQIIFNLLINAAHSVSSKNGHGRNHHIDISCYLETTDSKLYITVSDTGPGIQPEDQDKIFDPFFTTKKHGSGLGLAICKMLAQRLGAEISVDSTPFVKTDFTLSLDPNIKYSEEIEA